jgi:hypothetical protein
MSLMKDLLERPFDQAITSKYTAMNGVIYFGVRSPGTYLARNGADHRQGRGFRSGTVMRPSPRHSAMAPSRRPHQ